MEDKKIWFTSIVIKCLLWSEKKIDNKLHVTYEASTLTVGDLMGEMFWKV